MNYHEDSNPLVIMPEDEDRFFGTENINPVWGEWKIKYISWIIIILIYSNSFIIESCTSKL